MKYVLQLPCNTSIAPIPVLLVYWIIAKVLTDLGYVMLTGREVCDNGNRMGLPSVRQPLH